MRKRVFCLFLYLCPLLAQSDRGVLTGLVLDPAGAVIPNARVEAVNQATQVKYSGSSNEAGVYSLQQLPVGLYDLTVEATGFNRYVRKDISLSVAQTITINPTLTVGGVEQTVEVTSAAAALDTATSDVGTVVTQRMVMDLPLSVSGNMRNPEAFIFLTPGVAGDASNTQINGSQSRAKEVLLDGIGSTSPESGGILFTYPSVEAISEFKLLGSNFSAEYGRTGGGFEVFTTKSGTNRFHGSAFDYLRNDVFDARGFYSKLAPVNRQNEFGFTLGGPVRIPRVYNGTNKTFFHVVYSGFRFRQAASNALISIPPADFRNGDFSKLVDRAGRQVPIYDPGTTRGDGAGGFTRDQFSGNVIPKNRFSAVSAKILPLLPDPSSGGLLNNFLSVGARRFDRDQVDVKIDHSLTDRHRVSAFVYIGTQTAVDPANLPGALNNGLNNEYRSRWARLADDYVISPAVLNHIALGFTREAQFWNSLEADHDWPNKIGLKGVNTGAGNSFPYVTFTDGYATWGSTNGTKTVGSQPNNTWQVDENLSWIRGNHSLKFGGEVRWLQTNGADFFGSQGNFAFNSLETAFPTAAGRTSSGNAFASFLLGTVDRGQLNVLAVVPGNRYRYLALFAQDDWKATRKLTLNLGLRYDIYFPRSEAHDNLSSFDPSLANPKAGGRLGAIAFLGSGAGRSGRSSFADTYYRNFGPRFGFAFSATEKTVLRGGYGIYFAPGNATAGLRSSQQFGFGFNASPVFASTDTGVTPAFNWDGGFPQNFARPPLIDPAVANDSDVQMIGRGDARPPYFQNWSLGVQRELPAHLLLEADYVGVKGTRLGSGLVRWNELDPRYLQLGNLLSRPVTSPEAQAAGIAAPYAGFTRSVSQALRPYPQYLNIGNNANPNGNSTYHALQAKVEKRFSKGLTFLGTYTWARSISDNNVQAGGGPAGQTTYNRRLEKALSTDDVPQILNLSALYELPFHRRGALGKIVNGWTLTAIHQYSSGKPIVLTANNTLPLFNGALRPNVAAGANRRAAYDNFDPAVNRYINPSAFSAPAANTFGTAARSYADLRAFPNLNESWGAIKRTSLTERVTLTFRAEFFNVFNRVVLSAAAGNVSNSNFGQVSAQANSPRQGLMALKIEF